jgi:DNA adenine methylase Dam
MHIDGVMNYSGSKFKLLDQIIPLFDTSKETFVDLFAGGGSVYTNVVHLYKNIIANDIIEDIIKIQEKLILDIDGEFVQSVKNLSVPCKTSQEEYNKLRESYNKNKTPEKLYALMLSCTNNMLRMNRRGEMNQTWGKRCFNDNTEKKINLFIEHLKSEFNRINFISMSFEEVPLIKNSMCYIDSPYGSIQDENGNITNTQISEAGYNILWKKEDDIKLYEYCLKINENASSFMISGLLTHNGNTSWLLNKLIQDGFKYIELNCNYDKVSRKKNVDKNSKEIIVMNYKWEN